MYTYMYIYIYICIYVYIYIYTYIYGLNMLLISQVLVKFGISFSSKLLTNLVIHL